MKNQLFRCSICMLLLFVSCSKQESPETVSTDYFITGNLDFLTAGINPESGKGWPANGCKEIEVKIKIPLVGDISTSFYHCCVNYVCNMLELIQLADFFLGDRKASPLQEIEITYSEMITYQMYDFRIRPGIYQLNLKTGQVEGLQYDVWVNRN